MALSMTALAASWRRFWARESLPVSPPPPGRGPTSAPGLLARLLVPERLPAAPPASPPRPTSFLGRLLARECLPQPTDPAARRTGHPE